MAVILRRLLRIGRLPGALRAELEPEGILYFDEYVPVTRRFHGAVPGLRSAGSIASYVGALVLTEARVLATLSSLPKLAGRTIDLRWDDPQAGPVTGELSPSGLTLDVDVAEIDERFTGELSLHYKTDIPESVLDRLPRTSVAFDATPEFVFRAVGVAYHP